MTLVRFSLVAPGCLRIELAPDGHLVDAPSLFAAQRGALQEPEVRSLEGNAECIALGAFSVRWSPNGGPLHRDNLRVEVTPERGEPVRWWPGRTNRDNLGGTLRTLDGVRGPLPLGEGLLARDGWFLFDDSQGHLLRDGWVEERPATGGVDWYLFAYGGDYRRALRDLARVSGPVPLPPRYSFGSWYSRYWPHSSQDYRAIVEEYAARGLPLDVVVLDMDWHREGWTGWSWNRELLPDAEGLLAELRGSGLAVTLNLHPASGVAAHEDAYPAFMAALGRSAPADEPVPFDAGDPDYMRALFEEVHRPLEEAGVDFFWLDWQQQPYTRSLPRLSNLRWLNELYFRRSAARNGRGMSFSRWGGWGDHRNPIHFSGDASTGWAMLAFQVPFTSLAGNVGCFFWSHDIGGHMGPRNEETMTRWVHFGALSASLRLHATRDEHLDPRPWICEPPFADAMQRAYALRTSIMPYLYTAAAQSCREMVPMIRPMYIDWPDEERAYHTPQQYLLGDDLLVAPIVQPGFGHEFVAAQVVWFPETSGGGWVPFEGGRVRPGGSEDVVRARIDEIPIFVRAGALIPMQTVGPRMATAALDSIRLRCFPGRAGEESEAELYEDDGRHAPGSDNERRTRLVARWEANGVCLELGPGRGTFPGAPAVRSWTIELPGVSRITRAFSPDIPAHAVVCEPGAGGVCVRLPEHSSSEGLSLELAWTPLPVAAASGFGGVAGADEDETSEGPAASRWLEVEAGFVVRAEGRGVRIWNADGRVEGFHVGVRRSFQGRDELMAETSELPLPGRSVWLGPEAEGDASATPPFGLRKAYRASVVAELDGVRRAWSMPIESLRCFASTWDLAPPIECVAGRSLEDYRSLVSEDLDGDRGWTSVQAEQSGWLQLYRHWRGRLTHVAPARLVLASPGPQRVTLELSSRAGVALIHRGQCVFSQDAERWEDPVEVELQLELETGPNPLLFLTGRSHWGWGLRVAVDGELVLGEPGSCC